MARPPWIDAKGNQIGSPPWIADPDFTAKRAAEDQAVADQVLRNGKTRASEKVDKVASAQGVEPGKGIRLSETPDKLASGAELYVSAVLGGMKRGQRWAVREWARAVRIVGPEAGVLRDILEAHGLASVEELRAALERSQAASATPPEQLDRDAIDWLSARGWSVTRTEARAKESPKA